jgi:hypothetical protein
MSLTPDSSSSSYLTPAELLERYDARLVCQYVSDTGVPDDSTQILTDPNLLAILADASAMVESAALVGGRYRPGDLQALTATNNGTLRYIGGGLVKRLVANLAMGLLRQRRGMRDDQPFPPYEDALRQLELLRKGETIFPFLEAEEAGQIEEQYMELSDFLNQRRLTALWPRYWGQLPDDYPVTF